jgi:hypothetical protein
MIRRGVGDEAWEDGSIWGHHILEFIGSAFCMYYQEGVFFPALFFITELTTLPTNIHWYLQNFKLKDSSPMWKSIYTTNLAFRGLAFLLCRSWVAPVCALRGFYVYGANVFLAKFQEMPIIVQIGVCFNILFFGFLNTNWCYMVVVRFFSKGEKRKKPEKDA